MAFVLKDRVKETTTTNGTGSVTLAGPVQGYQGFSSVGDGNTTYYCIAGVAEWEVGIGTYSAGVLSRDTVLGSSANGDKVAFSSGVKDVFCTMPAPKVGQSVDVQDFTANGTWTKPQGAKLLHVVIISGGGGGGSGRVRTSSQTVSGGAGGGAGGRAEYWIPAASVANSISVVIGQGGAGGTAVSTNNTDGNNGSAGTQSTFGSYLVKPGSFGQGGSTATAAFGISGGGNFSVVSGLIGYAGSGGSSPPGSNSGLGGNPGSRGGMNPGGGGAAGGMTATIGYNGGAGGAGESILSLSTATTAGGGAAGLTGDAGNGANATDNIFGGSGGGGGASTLTGNGGNGGNGGYPGGGGGGGGSCEASNTSGAGGNGANGFIRVTTFF
jgi:hypothetical protein